VIFKHDSNPRLLRSLASATSIAPDILIELSSCQPVANSIPKAPPSNASVRTPLPTLHSSTNSPHPKSKKPPNSPPTRHPTTTPPRSKTTCSNGISHSEAPRHPHPTPTGSTTAASSSHRPIPSARPPSASSHLPAGSKSTARSAYP